MSGVHDLLLRPLRVPDGKEYIRPAGHVRPAEGRLTAGLSGGTPAVMVQGRTEGMTTTTRIGGLLLLVALRA